MMNTTEKHTGAQPVDTLTDYRATEGATAGQSDASLCESGDSQQEDVLLLCWVWSALTPLPVTSEAGLQLRLAAGNLGAVYLRQAAAPILLAARWSTCRADVPADRLSLCPWSHN